MKSSLTPPVLFLLAFTGCMTTPSKITAVKKDAVERVAVNTKSAASTLFGVVYHDDNYDGELSISEGNPLNKIIVHINSPGFSTYVTTDSRGVFTAAVPPGEDYELHIYKPAAAENYNPATKSWGKHSVVKGKMKNVTSPGRVSISAEYVKLNYGPKDHRYELWHSGPVNPESENVILIHGEHFTNLKQQGQIGKGQQRGVCDEEFGRLDDLLQMRNHGGYNVWEFEYARKYINGRYWTHNRIPIYGRRFNLAIQQVQMLSSNPEINIVSHSMGGLIARYSVQTYGRAKKIITLATGHFGYEITYEDADNQDRLCIEQMRPGSNVLGYLDNTYNPGNFLLASISCSRVDTSGMVEESSVSIAQIGVNDELNHKHPNIAFTITKEDHCEIEKIKYSHNPPFQLIREFLKTGIFPERKRFSPNIDPFGTLGFV